MGRELLPDSGLAARATGRASYSDHTWRLLGFPWTTESPGRQSITVRATDNSGDVQTTDRTGAVPDCATSRHTVGFTVAAR